jgi:hypothetical protein
MHRTVRQYVEGSKDSDKLLDLLSASGENDVEPTPASAAGRAQLYPDVCNCSSLDHAFVAYEKLHSTYLKQLL